MTVIASDFASDWSHGADSLNLTGLTAAAGDLIIAACVIASAVGTIAVPAGYTAVFADEGIPLVGLYHDNMVQFVFKIAVGGETSVLFEYDGGLITMAAVAAVLSTVDTIGSIPAVNDADGTLGQTGNQTFAASMEHPTKEFGVSWVFVEDSVNGIGVPLYGITGATDIAQVEVSNLYNRGRSFGLMFEEAPSPRAFDIDVTSASSTWNLYYMGSMWDLTPVVQEPELLSTVATIDHDLVIGIGPDSHHSEIHDLDGLQHTGGFLYKTGVNPVIYDSDMSATGVTPADGQVAVTYDTVYGITLVWTRINSGWIAAEVSI